ncbi:MAG: sigma 54-interacting transcriptional regulator [Treponema sp.]|nr:sigma 54-interacting transcriptional regulator [Treponema sp.]
MEGDAFIGNSSFVADIKSIVSSIKNNTASVFVTGERGSGKKTFARFLHSNCAGTIKGFFAYNSYDFSDDFVLKLQKSIENISDANCITVFIGQTESLTTKLQDDFLALIKAVRQKQLNVRFIFSSEYSLEKMVDSGLFSKELFYFITTVCVNIIPLRNRKDDIQTLSEYFLDYYKRVYGIPSLGFSQTLFDDTKKYFWPGNVAELKNSIEHAVVISRSPVITTSDLGISLSISQSALIQDELESGVEDKSLKTAVDSFKREYVSKILEENAWNQTKSAKVLGIQRTYVIKLINELNIRKK